MFNISADTVEPLEYTKTIEPTEAAKPTVVTKPTVAPTDTILEEEEATLYQLLDCAYEEDPIPNRVLDLLARGANYLKDLTIADCSIVNGGYTTEDCCMFLVTTRYTSAYANYTTISLLLAT